MPCRSSWIVHPNWNIKNRPRTVKPTGLLVICAVSVQVKAISIQKIVVRSICPLIWNEQIKLIYSQFTLTESNTFSSSLTFRLLDINCRDNTWRSTSYRIHGSPLVLREYFDTSKYSVIRKHLPCSPKGQLHWPCRDYKFCLIRELKFIWFPSQ